MKITITREVEAVVWDGTEETWKTVLTWDWDNNWIDSDDPGMVYFWGRGYTIPIGDYVWLASNGAITWSSQEPDVTVSESPARPRGND